MRILWIVNITMPDACEAMGKPRPVLGGWLEGYQEALLRMHPEVELHIVAPGADERELIVRGIHHHLFPASWLKQANSFASPRGSRLTPLSNQLPAYFQRIHEEVCPDVVHIHGSEFAHSRVWVESCGSAHTLVSIQGLASVYARYFRGGLSDEELKGCWSFNDWRWHRTLAQQQRQMSLRGEDEVALLRSVQHVAGRTRWDQSHTWAIHAEATYHTLQEVLRSPFYDESNRWHLDTCCRHTLFMSQSHYPIKGLHRMLDAMPLILRQYPDAQLLIVGEDLMEQHWRHRSLYTNVIRRKWLPLRDHVHFLGSLTVDRMIEHYRQAHVFVCPSAIENSCNSLCEAQLLGTPVVASYVGGLPDLVDDGHTGLLYRFEEAEMLAQAVVRLFGDDALALRLSEAERRAASARHDREKIARTLYTIYTELAQ